MDEFVLPAFYIVSRGLSVEHAGFVLAALDITPIQVVIISDPADVQLAFTICPSVLRVDSDAAALETAKSISPTGTPLVIGQADVLDAVYPDGYKEPVACSC